MPKRSAEDYVSDDGFVADDASDSGAGQPRKQKRSKVANDADRSRVKQTKSSHSNSGATRSRKQDSNGDDFWELNANGSRRVTISKFSGKTLVNVREYYEADDGERKPGKKGISMPIDQFSALLEVLPQIEDALKQKGVTIPRPEYDGADHVKKPADESEDEDGQDTGASNLKASKHNFEATSDEDENED